MTVRKDKKDEVAEETTVVEAADEELQQAKELADKYLDMARRLQADFDNYRKRTQRENEEFRKYANSGIIQDLLTIVDDLDRALAAATQDDIVIQGVRGVRSNLMKVLESNGLQEIDSNGMFDPNVHEALCAVDGDVDGAIAETFQKGYALNGKVLRFAKVKVTRKVEAAEVPTAGEEPAETQEKE